MSSAPRKPDAGTSPAKRRLSRGRLWLFRCGAVLLGCLLLLALEGLLRLAGVGDDLRLVVRAPGRPEHLSHEFNHVVDLAYYGRTNLSGPEPRRFDLPRPERTYRIVFLGASTVIGFPYSPELAFPRQVEVLLGRQDPETRFEVLNGGITSINSFAVADMLEQSLECAPDLIVVHTGHNEFYGPGGPASTALNLPPRWVRSSFAVRRWRLAQLLTAVIPAPSLDDDLLNVLPRTLEIPLGGAAVRQAEQNLRENLQRSVDSARAAGVPVLLTSVACNLRDQSPMRAVWPEGVSEARRDEWEQLVNRGEGLLRAGEVASALEDFLEAETICADHARLQYRKGQCREALDQPEQAFEAYSAARDLDACRFRAPSSFAAIVRELALGTEGPGDSPSRAMFLDVAAALHEVSHPAGPGYDLFLEHVHYNFEGHRRLGLLFAEFIQRRVRGGDWSREQVPSAQEMAALLGAVEEDHLAALSFSMQVLQTAPLRSALDSARQEQFTANRLSEHFHALSIPRREAFADIPMERMSENLSAALTEMHLSRENVELALDFSERGRRRRPWSAGMYLLAARVRVQAGDVDGAKGLLRTALALKPAWEPALSLQSALER